MMYEKRYETLFRKLGLVKSLIPGYIAIFLFCMGEGIDKGWIAEFFEIQGLSPGSIGIIMGVYGAMTAVASFFSGVFTDKWGPRRVMFVGVIIWLIFHLCINHHAFEIDSEIIIPHFPYL